MLIVLIIAAISFDPSATLRALEHPQGRESALVELMNLPLQARQLARTPEIKSQVATLALDDEAAFNHRVVAVRALVELAAEEQVEPLTRLLNHGQSGRSIALAREAARAIFRLGHGHRLVIGLNSSDPEVRAYAARAGGTPAALCALLSSDPWPTVRVAAAEGLSASQGPPCLVEALSDSDVEVRRAALKSIGELGLPSGLEPVLSIARDAKSDHSLRLQAIYVLGQLGHTKFPEAVLQHHLSKGGVGELTVAAMRALLVAEEHGDWLARLSESKDQQVNHFACRMMQRRGQTLPPSCVEKGFVPSEPPGSRRLQSPESAEDIIDDDLDDSF